LSNLFKGAFISFDESDARIIDNNELANKQIRRSKSFRSRSSKDKEQ